jgi:hypothetical protein
MSEDFNPRSTDAMFAEILANQKRDREERAEFRAEVKESLRLYGHRITALETFKTSLKAKVAIISAAVAAIGSMAVDAIKDRFSSGTH